MNVSIVLTDDQVEIIAAKVAEILDERRGAHESEWVRGAAAAAAHLGCPRSRVYDLVARGHLRPHRDGRVLAFRRRELDDHLDSQTRRAA